MGTIKTTNIEPIADNGTVTLGSSGDTITIPSGATLDLSSATQTGVGGTNTPAFEAQLNGNQTISNNVSTKMEFDTETFDTDNMYDATTNYRFTPTVAGKYYVYCKAEHYGGTTNSLTAAFVQIKKNGSTEINSEHSSYPDAILHKIFIYNAGIIDFNGSTDYVEAFIQGEGSNSTQELKWNLKTTLFGAYKIIE